MVSLDMVSDPVNGANNLQCASSNTPGRRQRRGGKAQRIPPIAGAKAKFLMLIRKGSRTAEIVSIDAVTQCVESPAATLVLNGLRINSSAQTTLGASAMSAAAVTIRMNTDMLSRLIRSTRRRARAERAGP